MAELDDMRTRASQIFSRMSLGEKVTVGATVIGIIFGVALLIQWVTKPDYALLFDDLELKEADKIVQTLQAEGVPYELEGGGRSVLVPFDRVYELRMRLASEGIPSSGGVGYEIFDKNNIGISDFVQKINYSRAIEGELSRTIMGMKDIDHARVHIVIPEDKLFKEDQKEPSASIALTLAGGGRISDNRIAGITHLVAASVEGLSSENVTVVDSRGNILSSPYQNDTFVGMTSRQHEIQSRVEQSLESKAQSMLDAVLGPGNSIVRVSAELDFQKIERTNETYDPDNIAILSEERTDETAPSGETQGADSGQLEHSITNYKVPRTVERITGSVGDIKRLSVAVLVDGVKENTAAREGMDEWTSRPRSEDELSALRTVVENAVGYSAERNDRIVLQNIVFDKGRQETEEPAPEFYNDPDFWLRFGQKAFPILIIGILLLILRSKLKKVRVSLPGRRYAVAPASSGRAREDMVVPRIDEASTPETIESAKLSKQISDFVAEKPSMAARLVRYWMLEE